MNKHYIVVFFIGFLLYSNTLLNKYALDDKITITENQFTKQGISGIKNILTTDLFVGFYGKDKNLVAGKRYRPLSLVTFAVEYQFFGENPFISHLINVLLYAFTGILLYMLLLRFLPDKKGVLWHWSAAFISTALYLAHPLHTEVVANIKGRDEILALLGALGALYFTIKWLDASKSKHLIYGSLCMFIAMFAKENAISFLLIIPVSVYFFTSHSIKDNLISLIPLLLVTALYIMIRLSLFGNPNIPEARELMNNPFINATAGEKYATVFYTLGLYIKLLIFPHPLTHDYYPFHIPIMGWGDYRAIFSLLLYLALVFLAFAGLKNKKSSSFCIIVYLASLSIVSNLVFPVGSFMNERFMYMPSIGFCLALGLVLTQTKYRFVAKLFIVAVFTMYGYKTISRNSVWKNDFTLATTDVKVSSNSAKSNMSAGLSLITKAETDAQGIEKTKLLNEAVSYLNRSLLLYPTYIQPMLLMGNAYCELGDYPKSLLFFENCMKIQPGYPYAANNIEHVGDVCVKKGDWKLAIKSYEMLSYYTPNNIGIYIKLGEVYGRNLGDNQNALKYFLIANDLDSGNTDVLNKMGIVYSMMGKQVEALKAFNAVIAQQPNNAQTLLNMGITYNGMGRPDLGEPFIQKAVSIDPSLKR